MRTVGLKIMQTHKDKITEALGSPSIDYEIQ